MNLVKSLKRSALKFHESEDGLEALQVVMIIAIAAVCLILIKNYWDDIKEWFENMMGQTVGEDNFSTDDNSGP